MVAVLLWIAWRSWLLIRYAWTFSTDDAYITLRYSRHLAEGRGLVWNPGEDPVEGYSNFTYVVFGAIALKAKLDPIISLKFLGAGAAIANLGLVYLLARHWVTPFLALLAPVLISAHVGNTWWAVSGLETTFFQSVLLVTALCTLRGMGYRPSGEDDEGGPRAKREAGYHATWLGAAGIMSALAGMTRPEGPLIFLIAAGTLVLDGLVRFRSGDLDDWRRARRAVFALVLPFGILYGGYFLIRMFYFGRLLPNTIYCKSNFRGAPPFKQHLHYWTQAAPQLLFALLIPLRRLDPRHFFIWGVPIAYGILMYRVDPIISRFDRHFMAAHAFVCVGVAIAMGHVAHMMLADHMRRVRGIFLVGLFLVLQGRLVLRVAAPMENKLEDYGPRMQNREDLGLWLDARMSHDETFVIGDAGMVPYLARAKVIDAFCLNSPVMTGPKIRRSPRRWVDWVLRQGPERIVVHSSDPVRLRPRSEYSFFTRLVKDGRFKADYEEEKRFPDEKYAYFVFRRLADAEDADRPNPNAAPKAPVLDPNTNDDGGTGGELVEDKTGRGLGKRSGKPIKPVKHDGRPNGGGGFIQRDASGAPITPETREVRPPIPETRKVEANRVHRVEPVPPPLPKRDAPLDRPSDADLLQ